MPTFAFDNLRRWFKKHHASLLPATKAEPASRLLAPGFSCRSQIHGLARIDALHPIEVIARQLMSV